MDRPLGPRCAARALRRRRAGRARPRLHGHLHRSIPREEAATQAARSPTRSRLANGDNDASQIQFAIPGSGPKTIQLTQALPAITAPVTIDGTTQGDVVAIDGGGVTDLEGGEITKSGVQGLVLAAGSDGSTIHGLTLGNFEIPGQPDPALEVDSSDNSIVGNTIGVEADGTTAAPDQAGILVTANGNTIGGSDIADGNVVVNSFSDNSNNFPDGILVQGNGSDFPAMNNQIVGNYVGVLADGTTVARNEESDIQVVDGETTTIGGPDPADGNVLAGAGSPDAIFLGDFADTSGGNATVQNNLIGLTADGSASLGPESSNGIDVDDHGSNTIADNTIADTYQGIDICDSPDNTVVRNVIGSNQASGGLDLGVHDQGISMENGFCLENGSATGNVIGGDAADGNTVLDSQLNDVAVDADNNTVSFNTLRGSQGGPVVEIAASHNQVVSNEITGAKVGADDGDGVLVDSGNANSIEENSIHANQNLGIELVSGANDDQAAPTLGSASVADGAITLQGTYAFPSGPGYTIDVYQSPSCESGGAGTTWVGAFNVDSFGDGSQPFTSPVLTAHSSGTAITATATAPDGSTSEFSNCATLSAAPNVFTVDTTGDGDDGSCLPGFCSFRDAINAVNGYAGASATIKFAISGGWPQTISLLTALPPITTPVSIDGTTETGTPANTPGVTLAPLPSAAVGLALDLAGGSGGSTVRGLAFGGFSCECSPGNAIQVESNGNTIAGDWFGVGADSAQLESSGTDIEVTGDSNTIGGAGADANVLVNGGNGILVDPSSESSTGPTGTVIQGNLIGFHPNGSPADVGASTGIDLVDAHSTVIGSDVGPSDLADVDPALGNLIADSGNDAIKIQRDTGSSSNSVVAGNFIGVDRSGNPTTPGGGNTNGIEIVDSSGDQIGPGDIIANSVEDGVLVESEDLGASSDRIVANSIYANGGLGIDLQGGANDNIAAPVITAASGNGLSGTFASSNSDPVFIEIFVNPSCDDTDATSGKVYDSFIAASPGQWNAGFGGLVNGQGVTVTATDEFTNDTSQFSGCAVVGAVPVFSNLTVNANPSSAGAGIDQVKISDVPNAWLSFFAGSTTSDPVGSTPVGSTPVGSTPVGSTPVGSTPVGSTPVGSTPVGSTPVGSTPVGSTGLLDLPVGSTPVGSTALSSLLLSQIPLCGDTPLPGTNQAQCVTDGATWAQVLAGTSFANLPLNSLTLANIAGDPTAKARLAGLPLRDVSFATTLFRSVHWSSLLLGSTPLSDLPGGFSAWCGAGGLIPDNGGDCTNATPSTSVLQMDVGGQLGSAPVGSTPVGSTPVGSTPVGSTPVGSTDIPSSLLANIPLADIAKPLPDGDNDLASVVDCSKVDCANGTLGDAYSARAILGTATFAQIQNAMRANGITINDILLRCSAPPGCRGSSYRCRACSRTPRRPRRSTTRSAPRSTARRRRRSR